MTEFTICSVQEHDIKALADLRFYMWNDFYSDYVPENYLQKWTSIQQCHEDQKEMVENCLKYSDNHHAIAALDQDKLAGICYMNKLQLTGNHPELENYDLELDQLYIWPEYRRQGLGRKLLTAMLPWLQRKGYQSVCSWVFDQNEYKRFYPKHGAEFIKTVHNNYEGTILPLAVFGWPDFQSLFDRS